jgi:hypothetical protein
MTVAERALKVKFKLWQRVGTNRNIITEEVLRKAIYSTGLSKASRGMKAVISYLRDYRHLGKSGEYYYVIYEKKEKANPRDVIPKEENDKRLRRISILGYDIQHNLATSECMPGRLYPLLMFALISDFSLISRGLEEKGSCTIKFAVM